MKLPKCMTASFEESLVLQDDSFISYMEKDTNKRGIYNGQKKITIKIIALISIVSLYGFSKLVKYLMQHPDPNSPVPQPEINFLPIGLFWIILVIYLLIWLYTLSKRVKNTKIYFGMVNANNFIFWVVISANLFFLTISLRLLSILGVAVFFTLQALVIYAVFRSKSRSLSKQLFNTEMPKDKLDELIQKMMKFLMKYGWIVVIGVVLWKFIFPNTTGVRTDIVGFIGVIALWFVMDVAIIVAEAYLFLPYLLYGYYKYKYPEDYRKWENKSQLEWYGEKYFNKYIKGTELEEKMNDRN